MNSLRRGGIVVVILLFGACALPQQNAYDEWYSFYMQVDTMSPPERDALFLKARAQYEQLPSAIHRLQLAYLTLLSTAPSAGNFSAKTTTALLNGINDDHPLAPIRDLLSRSLQLRENQINTSAKIKDLRKQCDVVEDSREQLRRESEVLQQEVVVCADQVEALKEIENVMSAPEFSPSRLP